jgi:hypothetical protein
MKPKPDEMRSSVYRLLPKQPTWADDARTLSKPGESSKIIEDVRIRALAGNLCLNSLCSSNCDILKLFTRMTKCI